MKFEATKYKLQSVATGKIFEDKGWTLDAPGEDGPSLIRAIYDKKQIDVKDDSYGLYKFADWLPVHRMLKGSNAPITYKSEGLAKKLGLTNLYITLVAIGLKKALICLPAHSKKPNRTRWEHVFLLMRIKYWL